jgi:hypothetical protein
MSERFADHHGSVTFGPGLFLVEDVDPSRRDVAAITGDASPVIAAQPGWILAVQQGIRVLRSAVTQQLRSILAQLASILSAMR